jgi:phosphoglycerate kinase
VSIFLFTCLTLEGPVNKATIRDIEVSNKRVLVRVDFNVPLDEETGAITDDSRIRAALPTIRYLTCRGARVILCSHLGRPKGKVVEKLRLATIAQRLSQILGKPVKYSRDSIGPEAKKSVAELNSGDVLVLENIRFHPEEKQNDASFAQALASLADLYVNDAFGTAHRAHASIVGVTQYLPSAAGLLLEKEIETLSGITESPAHPFAALLGGAKVSDKVGMIENVMGKVDYILIGGGMAATFLKAKSYEVGLSLIETDKLGVAAELIEKASKSNVCLLLPVDVVVADEISQTAEGKIVAIEDIASDKRIVDIGPRTAMTFKETLQKCKTVFWNGPMGIYEIPQFAGGTETLANALANLNATTVLGGGSTADIVTDMGLADKMTFVSTGGGASLEFISGKALPGIEALPDRGA